MLYGAKSMYQSNGEQSRESGIIATTSYHFALPLYMIS